MPVASQKNNLLGVACMLTAAVFFTAMGVFTKIVGPDTTLWHLALTRFSIGALGMWGITAAFRKSLWGTNKKLLLIRGSAGTIGFICQTQAILTLPLAAALVLFFMFPVFAAVLSPWVNNERTPRGDWPFIILSFAGAVIILWPGTLDPGFNFNYILALAGSFLAGFTFSLVRKLRADNTPMTLYFYLCLSGALTCLPVTLIQNHPFSTDSRVLLGLLAVALLAMIGQLLMNQGFKYVSAPRGGVLMMSEVVMGSIAGMIFFHEQLTLKFLIGAAAVIGSGLMLTLRPARPL